MGARPNAVEIERPVRSDWVVMRKIRLHACNTKDSKRGSELTRSETHEDSQTDSDEVLILDGGHCIHKALVYKGREQPRFGIQYR